MESRCCGLSVVRRTGASERVCARVSVCVCARVHLNGCVACYCTRGCGRVPKCVVKK